MKTIAIANQKGGTGKTTTAYNLGIALTQQDYRVLMVDFDPQGNLSCYCGIPPEQDLEQTITELLMKVAYEKPLSHRECVYQSKRTDDSAPQVDFIPSNLRLASFELAMGTMMCREVLLKTCLEQYSSQYDYCIIDCSPSVGLGGPAGDAFGLLHPSRDRRMPAGRFAPRRRSLSGARREALPAGVRLRTLRNEFDR